MKPTLCVIRTLCAGLLAVSIARADVLVVDASGGGAFLDIQPAVDASHDGDTILIKMGTYTGFSIVNRSLHVVADANASVAVSSGIQVRSLAADRDVVLAGLVVHGISSAIDWRGNGLYLKNDLGSVRVVHCTLMGGTSSAFSPPPPPCAGAYIEASSDVAFVACTLHGGYLNGVIGFTNPPGLSAKGSMIATYDTACTGSAGYSDCALHPEGGHGGAGAQLLDSFLFASGASFIGGDGGDAPGWPCPPDDGGDGAVGLSLSGQSGSYGETLDCQLAGGSAGLGSCSFGCGNDGTAGEASTFSGASWIETLPGSKRVLSAATVVRELAPFALSYQGLPGDEVGVLISQSTEFHHVPALLGVKLVKIHPPALAAWLGFANPVTGHLDSGFTFPDAGPGVEASTYYLQAIVRTPQGIRVLGSPRSVAVLDPAF